MTSSDDVMRVVPTDDGFLVFGQPQDLASFDSAAQGHSRPLSAQAMAKAGPLLTGVSQFQAQSGRWMKLTDESVGFMRSHGIKAADVTAGVLRRKDSPLLGGNGGKTLKHLNFQSAALATPAAPAALAAMATQQAIQMALDDITEFLERIDAKLDRVLKQPRVEMRGDLGGVAFALEEAEHIMATTGTMSDTTFRKVQTNTFELQRAQAHCLAQLDQITEDIRKDAGHADALSKVLRDATNDIPFWLKALAQAISLHDRQYLLELARVAAAEPDDLESHRLGIKNARAARTEKIGAALTGMLTSIQESGALGNLARVVNFGDAKRIHKAAEEVREAIDMFAAHAGIDGVALTAQELTPWAVAARGLLTETASTVKQTGARARQLGTAVAGQVGEQVEQVNERAQNRRLSSLQRRAEKLKQKMAGKDGSEAAPSQLEAGAEG